MDRYVTGAVIRKLRENKRITQKELADMIHVSDKAVSKWETGQGFPDISLLETLAKALGISVVELLSGEDVRNRNRSFNITRGKFYVCPVCGNVIQATGEALVICCGITLPPLETEEEDPDHVIHAEITDDEYYVTVDHPMTKEHYISFLAAISDQGVQFVKLYPEGNAEARFRIQGVKTFYAFCNHHGLYELKAPSRPRRQTR
ncbi:MAG: helix-turn-helix domain-containing protein [Clostridia bacterium]|nr:helix-turn-helix domain-containing protein [Clostridia bacterium]